MTFSLNTAFLLACVVLAAFGTAGCGNGKGVEPVDEAQTPSPTATGEEEQPPAASTPSSKPQEKEATPDTPASEEAKTAKSKPAKAPATDKDAKKKPLSKAELLAAVQAAADPFTLYDVQQQAKAYSADAEMKAAIEKKWNELEKEHPPQELVDGLSFVALNMKPAGEGKCKFSVLLKCAGPINKEYQLAVVGTVDKSHENRLSESGRRLGREVWPMREWDNSKSNWKDPERMADWTAGNHYVLRTVDTCQPIPFKLRVTPQVWEKGKWASNVGNSAEVGWVAALAE